MTNTKKPTKIYTKLIKKLSRTCPFCFSEKIQKTKDRNLFLCRFCKKRFSKKKIKDQIKILELFSLEISARKASKHLGFSYNKIKSIFDKIREKIFDYQQKDFKKLLGELELDESYFGGKRKGKRGRGANNKKKVFGILERKNIVYTVVVDNVSKKTLMKEIKNASLKGSVYFTDTFKSYAKLNKHGKHFPINHQKGYFAKNHKKYKIHTNGIEGFWSFAKERMLKYHGVSKDKFNLYLKEMEFRFNQRKENIFDKILQIYFFENFDKKIH